MTAAALDTYIMSACPDAEYAISQLLSPAIAGTQHVTECAFHMIGQLDDSCELGVRCMHGERECQGNAYILSASQLDASPTAVFNFTQCLVSSLTSSSSKSTHSIAEQCADRHGLSHTALETDYNVHGKALLQQSINNTANVGITTSATILLQNQLWIVRDGSKWRDYVHGQVTDDATLVKRLQSDLNSAKLLLRSQQH